MNITFNIDIPKVCAQAEQYQEHPEDYSYPFWMAFHDLYPEAGNLACKLLKGNFLGEIDE